MSICTQEVSLPGRVNWGLAWDTCLASAFASGKSAALTYFPLVELGGTIPAIIPGGSYVTPLGGTVLQPCPLGIPELLNEGAIFPCPSFLLRFSE